VEVERLGVAEPALVDPSHPVIRRAADAVEAAVGWRPAPVRIGGSLPIVTALTGRGVPVILSGFYLPDDGIHSPNEGISLEHLDVGTCAAVAILESLAGGAG
jgi:acetylornithine deacetylase/succinyl-diaminopimelate desuccinylase-like protein